MPKRNRDAEGTSEVTVKNEELSDDMDVKELKEMVRTGLEREAKLAAEKMEVEKEKDKLLERITLQHVHRLFKESQSEFMDCARKIPNPNLLNQLKNKIDRGDKFDWILSPEKTASGHPGYSWWYVDVSSWSEVLKFFKNGCNHDTYLDLFPRHFSAVATIVIMVDERADFRVGCDVPDRSSYLVVGALSYRCTQKFYHHLYKEKYKEESELLWPDPESLAPFHQSYRMSMENISIPKSLEPLFTSLPFDGVVKGIFLPVDSSRTVGATFDLDLDKMLARPAGGERKDARCLFESRWSHAFCECDEQALQQYHDVVNNNNFKE